jgi:rootletin
VTKLKQSEARLEKDKRQLLESLENATTRGTRLEVTKRALEGDVQRLQKVLSEREAEITVYLLNLKKKKSFGSPFGSDL